MFHKWVWSLRDRIVLQLVRLPILFRKWGMEKRVLLVYVSFNKKYATKKEISICISYSSIRSMRNGFFFSFCLLEKRTTHSYDVAATWYLWNHFIAFLTSSTNTMTCANFVKSMKSNSNSHNRLAVAFRPHVQAHALHTEDTQQTLHCFVLLNSSI